MTESHVLLIFATGLIMGGAFGWACTMDHIERKYILQLKSHAPRGKNRE